MQSILVLAVSVGLPVKRTVANEIDSESREWESGIFKSPAMGPVFLDRVNLVGDGQADLVHHGGPDRALLIYTNEHYPAWESELGRRLEPGSFGENLTIEGGNERTVCLGDRWRSSTVEIEVSPPRLACYKLARRLESPGIQAKVIARRNGGWYARTVSKGMLQAGDRFQLVARPNPDWSIDRAFDTFMDKHAEVDSLMELQNLDALSDLWKSQLERRLERSV